MQSDSIYKIKYYMSIIDYLMEETEQTENQTSNEDDSKKNWRTEFIKYGGFNYFLQLLSEASQGKFNSEDSMIIYSFVLKMLKKYMEAATSKYHKDIYSNLAFIQFSWIDYSILLKVLLGEKKPEVKDIHDTAKDDTKTGWQPGTTVSNDEIKKSNNISDKLNDTRMKKLTETEQFIQFRDSISPEFARDLIDNMDITSTINQSVK